MNNHVDFIPERDKELYEAYRKAMRDRSVKSHQEAIEMAINSKASRFYISTFQAYRGILRIRRGEKKEGTRPVRDRMINDIYERVKELSGRREFKGCSIFFITSFAVFQEAPSFYISYSRALSIISKLKRERRKTR